MPTGQPELSAYADRTSRPAHCATCCDRRRSHMPATKLKEFLDTHNIKYVSITHSKAYTAQGIAAAAHISGKELAKTVMIAVDGQVAMAILPASETVNLDSLKVALNARKVDLASEDRKSTR